jgi:hypothetical protein
MSSESEQVFSLCSQNSGVRFSGYKPLIHHSPAVWCWTNHSVTILQRDLPIRINKWDNVCTLLTLRPSVQWHSKILTFVDTLFMISKCLMTPSTWHDGFIMSCDFHSTKGFRTLVTSCLFHCCPFPLKHWCSYSHSLILTF